MSLWDAGGYNNIQIRVFEELRFSEIRFGPWGATCKFWHVRDPLQGPNRRDVFYACVANIDSAPQLKTIETRE